MNRLLCNLIYRSHYQRQFYCYSTKIENPPNILITGGLGQLGLDCANLLRKRYGTENVILSDITKPSDEVLKSGPYVYANILNYKIAIGEQNVALALKVNIDGLHNVLKLALQHKLRIFVPSSIGAFGPDSPRNPTPNVALQRPSTFYGISKVHAELLGEYYHKKFGLDFRSLRFPGVVSNSKPGGGTTDYATAMFHEAKQTGKYECYLKPNTKLPMIYIEDCLRALQEFITLPEHMLCRRVYNINGVSFSPNDLVIEIQRYFPEFKVTYNPDRRQKIAESWPEELDGRDAQRDWLWKPMYNFEKLVQAMIKQQTQN